MVVCLSLHRPGIWVNIYMLVMNKALTELISDSISCSYIDFFCVLTFKFKSIILSSSSETLPLSVRDISSSSGSITGSYGAGADAGVFSVGLPARNEHWPVAHVPSTSSLILSKNWNPFLRRGLVNGLFDCFCRINEI